MLKNFFKFGKKKKDEDQKDTLENQIEKEIEESQSEIDKIKAETEKEIKETAEEILGKNRKKSENKDKNLKIGILGLAYKPDIDDLRESPAIEIAEILRDKGYNVIACEPNVHKKEVNKFELYTFSEIIDKSDYLVLTQGHKEFKENINKLKEKNIYDCLGLLK